MDNDNYLTLNEQGLVEMSPVTSRDAQLAFIDNYRQTQADNTAQIGEQAHALGSDLPASQGGLHGPSSYWRSRYQTPQTESRVANLRTAAQLSALNQLMSNDQANWADKLNQAQRNYNKARLNNSLSSSGGGNDDSTENLLKFLTQTNDTSQITINDNTNEDNVPTTTYQGKTVQNINSTNGQNYNVVTATNTPLWAAMSGGGTDLGLWPNGSKMVPGSTYTFGGKTYLYDQVGTPYPQLYQTLTADDLSGGN